MNPLLHGPLLHLRGIKKSYTTRRVLDIEELSFAAGESYAITGDNGAGKTTLLRLISGLESGGIASFTFAGKQLSITPYPTQLRHEIIYVHQHPYLFNTSVAHNVEYGLKMRGISAHECQIAARQAMHWAGITHLADTVPTKLSGGEKQRVALARTRMLNPKIILLDEPTASLDSAGRIQVINLIEELCDENICMLIACHDRELIDLPKMHTVHLSSADARVGTT
jgi:tungstate transport system ATP-binding protein